MTQQQLELRQGQVRCGHCHTVFDGVAALLSLAPAPRAREDPALDEAALGPPTVTLRNAHALEPAPTGGHGDEASEPAEADDDARDLAAAEAAYAARFS